MKTVVVLTLALLLDNAASSVEARHADARAAGEHSASNGVAATGAGEAVAAPRNGGKAKADARQVRTVRARADRDTAADTPAAAEKWPGPTVDASEIT